MFFDNNVIDTILILAIISIIGLWIYQNNTSLPSNIKNAVTNSFNSLSNSPALSKSDGIIVNDIEFPHEHNKTLS